MLLGVVRHTRGRSRSVQIYAHGCKWAVFRCAVGREIACKMTATYQEKQESAQLADPLRYWQGFRDPAAWFARCGDRWSGYPQETAMAAVSPAVGPARFSP